MNGVDYLRDETFDPRKRKSASEIDLSALGLNRGHRPNEDQYNDPRSQERSGSNANDPEGTRGSLRLKSTVDYVDASRISIQHAGSVSGSKTQSKYTPQLFRGLSWKKPNSKAEQQNHNDVMDSENLSRIMQESTNVFIIRQTGTRQNTGLEWKENKVDDFRENELLGQKSYPSPFDGNSGPSVATYLTEDEIFWLMSKRRQTNNWEESVEDEGFIDQFLFPNDPNYSKFSNFIMNEKSSEVLCKDGPTKLEKVTEENENPAITSENGNNFSENQNKGFPPTDMLDIQMLSTIDRPLDRPYSEVFPRIDVPLASEILNSRRVKSSSTPIKQSQCNPTSLFMYSELAKIKNIRNGKAFRKYKKSQKIAEVQRLFTSGSEAGEKKNPCSNRVTKIPEAGVVEESGRASRDSAYFENDSVDERQMHG